MKKVCVYCGKELFKDNYPKGDLCEKCWFDFRYGVILDEDPKFDVVETEYYKDVED